MGDDVRHRGFAESGGAVEQAMIQRICPFAGSVDKDPQIFFDSILADIKNQILEFGPTVIYSPTDTDHHQDHWGLAKFVNQALIELAHVRTWKSHFGYLIHWEANEEGWPTSSSMWTPPSGHAPPDLWVTLSDFEYSREEKSNVIDLYESQVFVGRAYLVGFAKDAEIFWLESW